MKSGTRVQLTAALISVGLSGCGLTIPQVGEFWDHDYLGDPDLTKGNPTLTATAQIEYEIKQKVYCELRYAVQQAELIPVGNEKLAIPHDWGVQLQLSLEVDESVALTPSVTFTRYLTNVMKIFGVFPITKTTNDVTIAQSFSLGFGATLSSEALRTDKFNTYYSIKNLRHQETAICKDDGKPDPQEDPFNRDLKWPPARSSPLLIQSDLGIKDWLIGALFYDIALPSSSPQPSPPVNGGGKLEGKLEGKASSGGSSSGGGGGAGGGGGFNQDSFSQEIKFIIISSGNIQPTWKLLPVSANAGNTPFFSIGRTRTHDLLMTIGPPTQRTTNDFLASQIGQAVQGGISQALTSGVPAQ
jgi:uncharacterized membrane protein YgcG